MDLLKDIEKRLREDADYSALSPEAQLAMLKSRAKHIVGEERLLETLVICAQEKRPMRVKYGIDATGQSIHLGHAVPLFVLRRLQQMGHHVVLIIGDFTAQVGDPSGRVSTRPMLTPEEIKANANRYAEQAGRIIDIDKTEVVFNSSWLSTYSLAQFFSVLSGLTVSSAMQREDFRKRESITRAELLYSTLMGIDSFMLKTELELGGDDQLLNFYDAVRIMENGGLRPESAVTTDILLGTSGDGQKMSKSLGNFILVSDAPHEMFGKIMSIADDQMEQYFKLLTDLNDEDWQRITDAISAGLNPMQVKRMLARVVVSTIYDEASGENAEKDFDQRIVNKEVPDEVQTVEVVAGGLKSMAHLLRASGLEKFKSVAEAERLLKGGGVHVMQEDGSYITLAADAVPPPSGTLLSLRIGKRTFVNIKIT